MLSSLHIENIAVIRCADIDIGKGFTVLTGETGAGKSIIIDSINFLMGNRTGKELIRNGENSALVSAIFTDIPQTVLEKLSGADGQGWRHAGVFNLLHSPAGERGAG